MRTDKSRPVTHGLFLLAAAVLLTGPTVADARVLTAIPGAASGTPGHYRTLSGQLVAGDTLYLPAGTYPDRLNLQGKQGRVDAWITILGPATGPAAIITTASLCCNTVQLGDNAYIAIRNITVDSGGFVS